MTYLDIERKRVLKKIKSRCKAKNIRWEKIEIYLYSLQASAFKEGVYIGKTR